MTAEARRESILDVATPVFADKGFEKTTTKEIAEIAGISEALLFKHFPSKDSLYSELQTHCCDRAQEFADIEPGTQALVQMTVLMITEFMKTGNPGEEGRDTFRLMMYSFLEETDFARDLLESGVTDLAACYSKSYEVAIEQGDIETPMASENLFWYVQHLALALGLFGMSEKPVVDYSGSKQTVKKQAIEFCLRGIGLKSQVVAELLPPILNQSN